ncbi:MAG: glycoside hydrolase family 9 protein [Clostridium sp.]
MKLKKILSIVLAASMMLPLGLTKSAAAEKANADTSQKTKEDSSYNYARAFQLSMYFYDANMCGDVENGNNKLSWRGNCHEEDKHVPLKPKDDSGKGTNMSKEFIETNKDALDPDGDGTVDLSGGFHDAGDHVKFGLPQGYAASTLGWGYYEFKDAYEKVGEKDHIENILRWFNDYFMRCTFRNSEGDVVAFAYQVGDGTSDHTYWGSPELQTTARPAFFATPETPASDQCAEAAASLAVNYLNFKDSDREYAEKSLDTAKALYKFAVKNRGLGFSGGFYNSSYDEDEMSWAAVWLYYATQDESYINDITAVDESGHYTGYMKKIINTTDSTWQNIWTHSWDTVWGGVFAKLAPATNDPKIWYFFRWNAEYWSGVQHEDASDGTFLKATPAGFRVLTTWGSARYNTAAQLCALVYNKYKPNKEFTDWAKSQMDYILGDNPEHVCYEVGYDENSAKHPHHRASHGSDSNSMVEPEESKHTLWGALVGGPDDKDNYEDVRTDFVKNEVAIDYNAAFVGALAGLYENYGQGQKAVENFRDDQKDERPYYATSKIEQENSERTQVNVKIHNDTTCPPTFESNMKARYYFNISELKKAGQSIDDVNTAVMYDQCKAMGEKGCTISGPYAYDENNGIYYVELDWTGNSFHGTRELQFALVAGMDSNYKVHWDPSNDFSRNGMTKEEALNENIPVYLGDTQVYGNNPSKGAEIKLETSAVDGIDDYNTKEAYTKLKAVIEKNDEKANVDYVEFFANGESIGKAEKEPYEITKDFSYLRDPDNEEDSKDVEVTAKAHLDNGEVVESKNSKFKVNFKITQSMLPKLKISNVKDGEVLDITKNPTIEIKIDNLIDPDNTDKTAVYKLFADGKEVAESEKGQPIIKYTPETDKKGIENVKLEVKGESESAGVLASKKVKVKIKYSSIEGLKLTAEGNEKAVTNTICRKIILSNDGKEDIDLNKVKIRYYFTNDSNKSQTLYTDSASIILNKAPFYVNLKKNINYTFNKVENPVEGADTYLELSFKDVSSLLEKGDNASMEIRIANSDWKDFNQLNDYSYKDADHIVVLYDDAVIEGVEP